MKQKILIVDDKPENLYVLEDFINENLDVEVCKAENGNDALKLILHNNFSLAILDVQMPEMDGYELATYIRNRRESRNTPIVFLSAVYSDDFHVFKGYEAGVVDFITKPFNPQLLLNKIRFFIKLKEEELKRKRIEDNLQELVFERTKELEQAKYDAESANKAKSNFLAVMSHEIRTPLHALLGMTNMLEETEPTEKQKEYINTIKEAGSLLLSIINDILDFSKIEAGKMELEYVDFELISLIEKILKLYQGKASEKNIELKFENYTDEQLFLNSDPVRIKQVINNLLNNAIKFTENGEIKIELYCEKTDEGLNNITVKVSDTGIGIDAEKVSTLFNPFTQEDSSITRRYGGSGLGLSIIKSILKEMNGDIKVQSEKGKGSIFTVTMILENGAVLSEAVKEEEELFFDLNKNKCITGELNILVAEDGQFNQILIKEMLSKIKCSFDIAENGKIAINKYKSGNYNLILMDCQMPEIDGFEAAKQIRKMKKSENVPIIALTANAVKGIRKKCQEVGMDDYLSKPFNKDALFRKLRKWHPELDNYSSEKKSYEEGVISLKTLKTLYNDIGSEAYSLIECFINMIPETVEELSRLLEGNKIRELSESCHLLKGTSAAMGLLCTKDKCDKIAHHSESFSPEILKDYISEIQKNLLLAKDELNIIHNNKLLGGKL